MLSGGMSQIYSLNSNIFEHLFLVSELETVLQSQLILEGMEIGCNVGGEARGRVFYIYDRLDVLI